MITYEITKKKPEPIVLTPQSYNYQQQGGLFQRLRAERERKDRERMVRELGTPQLSSPVNLHGYPIADPHNIALQLKEQGVVLTAGNENLPHVFTMGKLKYAQWLSDKVYSKFPKGTQVTFRCIPIVIDQAPQVWFVVGEIQEIYYSVQMDRDTNEPRAIGIMIPNGRSNIPVWYPPSLLRTLHPTEVIAIDQLRNQASERRNIEATDDNGVIPDIGRSVEAD